MLGSDIKKSISPAMQNMAFEKTGYGGRYNLFQISNDKFDSAMEQIQRMDDVKGFNITAPYKEMILPYLTRLDAQSKAVGAVNTVKISRDGKMTGFNTDTDGIAFSLSKLGALKGSRCVMLGAGGAARACAYTVLKRRFDSLVVMNRTRDRAEKLRSDFKKLFPRAKIRIAPLSNEQFAKEIRNCDLLINAVTSPFPIAVDFSRAPRNLKFFDLGYKKPSSILRIARKSKIKSIDGLLMLAEQGAKSFEIWTGMKAPRKSMLLAGKRQLAK
ncbi:MAG: shikimate dehydrogenase family protein [Nitrososphaerales archaeon]